MRPRRHLMMTVEESRMVMLPTFVQHYGALGVDDFWVTVHFDPRRSPAAIVDGERQAAHLLASCVGSSASTHVMTLTCPFDAMALRCHHDRLQAAVVASDWILWADIDEFQEYPDGLDASLGRAAEEGATYISGEFVDRVAEDGSLPVMIYDRPLWNQFPLGCALTSTILGGSSSKVVCARASVRIRHANHDPARGQRHAVAARELAAVHHFKWDATVIARLAPRLDEDWKQRCPWWVQTARFYEHLAQHGRIDLNSLDVVTLVDDTGRRQHHPALWDFVRSSRAMSSTRRTRAAEPLMSSVA